MALVLSLLQQMSVYLVIAYLLSKTPVFMPLLSISGRLSHKYVCYVLFSGFCILGTYFGLHIQDAIANTRAIGAVLGGLLGGPVVGFLVGLTGGLHRYSLGGFTDLACAISTTAEGVIGGLMHRYLVSRNQTSRLFSPTVVLSVTFVAELVQMAIILAVAEPFSRAYELVSAIAAPMVIANSVGAAMFMSIIVDRKTLFERYSAAFSSKALKIAERSVGILSSGFNQQSSEQVAAIIQQETGVGAVAITDREKILAFTGIGDDHHLPGTPIASDYTRRAIADDQLIYIDGADTPYCCSLSPHCKLGSVLVIPLRGGDGYVLGTVKLYEPKRKLFSAINVTMGEGIARLLSNQILTGRYQRQQTLLTQAELNLLRAQVNPHFLFNALNTISAVVKREPERARQLIQHLSTFFRSNLKQNRETVSLEQELNHLDAYLELEHARFADRMSVEKQIDPAILHAVIPSFTLQPLVENAVKHGISQLMADGQIIIRGWQEGECLYLQVEDNAGLYQPAAQHAGLGLRIVDKRIRGLFGGQYGLKMTCQHDHWTRATVTLPLTDTAPNKETMA
ncbi:sensor histidine kinase [Salinivibrio sp. YCSC6]|uniref:sensor histidine kinase n=1 Tax=Salinivibrio sp. YCSC6 TaxID=2003370 RepID=UPI000BBB938A|nr:sensor histidine kinase [Salinivibrio sp. YCSC6]PCE69015.1 sensor histidine kinase [Salinivibrio sp. YCSC6]QCF36557.1 sensor histidine kinase [Salinivibrio sp. YCSC6]